MNTVVDSLPYFKHVQAHVVAGEMAYLHAVSLREAWTLLTPNLTFSEREPPPVHALAPDCGVVLRYEGDRAVLLYRVKDVYVLALGSANYFQSQTNKPKSYLTYGVPVPSLLNFKGEAKEGSAGSSSPPDAPQREANKPYAVRTIEEIPKGDHYVILHEDPVTGMIRYTVYQDFQVWRSAIAEKAMGDLRRMVPLYVRAPTYKVVVKLDFQGKPIDE